MKEATITVLKVEPMKPPVVAHLNNELEALQDAVSIGSASRGLIEIIELNEETCLLCNEEGKLLSLTPNRRVGDDIICGVFYLTGQDEEGNLASLSPLQISFLELVFNTPEFILPSEVEMKTDVFFEEWEDDADENH